MLRVDVDAPELGRLVAALVLVDGLDLLHVLVRDVEVKELKVLLQPLHLGGLGDHHRVLLEAPPEDQLCRRLAVLLGQLLPWICSEQVDHHKGRLARCKVLKSNVPLT